MIPHKRAVVDIGSNAIRFVAYGGARRAPVPLYNEKSPVSLGKSLLKRGEIDPTSMLDALNALARFSALARDMGIERIRVVATAAVREASNGSELIERARGRGINVELLSGEQEALAAGMGVLSDTPWANGYVADLGGGSLELVRVWDGKLGARFSLPMGTMRLKGADNLPLVLTKALDDHPDFIVQKGLHFHLVGGAWRAMARFDQHLTGYPLTILGNYAIAPERLDTLVDESANVDALRLIRAVPSGRIETLHDAARLAKALRDIFEPDAFVASAQGIREGLLYDSLTAAERAQDPLIACTRFEGQRLARFAFSGDALFDWMSPLFDNEDAEQRRLRHATCLLADSAWQVHPEYRSAHARDVVLHGNWLGIDGKSRLKIARALFAAYGGKADDWAGFDALLPAEDAADAVRWGLAIRLALRLDGGVSNGLAYTQLRFDAPLIELAVKPELVSFDHDSIRRRLRALASAFDCKPSVVRL